MPKRDKLFERLQSILNEKYGGSYSSRRSYLEYQNNLPCSDSTNFHRLNCGSLALLIDVLGSEQPEL